MENIGSSKQREEIRRNMLAQSEAARQPLRAGYLMIRDLEINNFRCFENQRLEGLGRLNIIVGANAAGKSALLEAIYLACGAGPNNLLALRIRRQYGNEIQFAWEPTQWEELWSDLFYNGDVRRSISIRAQSSPDSETTEFSASFGRLASLTLVNGSQNQAAPLQPFNVEWRDRDGSHTKSIILKDGSVDLSDVRVGLPLLVFYSANTQVNPREAAGRFSSLSTQKRAASILTAIKSEFNFIQDIRVETNGGVPLLYADTGGTKLIPLGGVSLGILTAVNILVAIESHPRGLVLIDEIENGMYYERLPWLWRSVLEACKRNDTQVFATTHSREAIKALAPVLSSAESDFRLIRTVRKDSGCVARVFEGKYLEAAIDQNVEIR